MIAIERPETDRELLLLTVQRLEFLGDAQERLVEKVDIQNGRISRLEQWRWYLLGAWAVVLPLTPLLVFEVRQFLVQ